MNWKKIKEDYPKALQSLNQWLTNSVGWDLEDFNYDISISPFYDRMLFDFFDKQQIEIGILIDIDKETNEREFFIDFHIQNKEVKNENSIVHGFKIRHEGEKAAFEKAFKILEERLTTNKN